jgi:8-amino-7-oxononanoate synthase
VKRATPPALRHLEGALRDLEGAALLRVPPPAVDHPGASFCSNDYLGLAGKLGAGASRLIVGERPEHVALERALARWLDVDAALVFSSGYAANLGAVAALAGPGDLIVSDELNHASLIDGCRLSRARVHVVPHSDCTAIEGALRGRSEARAWVLTESYFSMDADGPDLRRLRRLCDEHHAALLVDEAHALGIFGPSGRGLCAEAGVVPDVLVGTLGKAFGASGAFVAGCTPLVAWLWNRARSFVFSTGFSPVVAEATRARLGQVIEDGPLRERLRSNVSQMRAGLDRLGLRVLGHGPIMPIVVGDSSRALLAGSELRRRGVLVHAVRPPTVAEGTSRLRVTVTATHSAQDIVRALAAFEECTSWLRPLS